METVASQKGEFFSEAIEAETTLKSLKKIKNKFLKGIDKLGLLDTLSEDELCTLKEVFKDNIVSKEELVQVSYEELKVVFDKLRKAEPNEFLFLLPFMGDDSNIAYGSKEKSENVNQVVDMISAISFTSSAELNKAFFITMYEIDSFAERTSFIMEFATNISQSLNNKKIKASFVAGSYNSSTTFEDLEKIDASFDYNSFIDNIIKLSKKQRDKSNHPGIIYQYEKIIDGYMILRGNLG